jgi:hypothetical protein
LTVVEAVLPNVFQNGFNSTEEAAPPEEPELELFLEELQPCQTDPTLVKFLFGNMISPLCSSLLLSPHQLCSVHHGNVVVSVAHFA